MFPSSKPHRTQYTLFLLLIWLAVGGCKRSTPTFSADIAPLVYKNCTPCHRPGEAGPFPLLTYEDVKRKANMIKEVASSHFMPPWPADPNYSHFANERVLTDEEIELLVAWVDAQCPIGDSTHLPHPPALTVGSSLGKPDLVVRMPSHYAIAGDNQDKFLVMKIPYEMAQDTFVRAIEFVPGNRKLLHHMNGHLIQYTETVKKKNVYDGTWVVNQEENEDSRVNHQKLGLLYDDGSYPLMKPSVVNYLPGMSAITYPQSIGGYRFSKKGAFYINNMHYGPTTVAQSDSSYFNIFFSPTPPQRPVSELILGTLGVSAIQPELEIGPNEVKNFKTEITIKRDISLLNINPHMHLIGKTFKAYAIVPGSNDTVRLIKINHWDFRWQYVYTFKHPIKLEAGSRICVEALFDNTANNPNNPYNPPRTIHGQQGSMKTTDEMLQLICSFLPYKPGDEHINLEHETK